MRKNAFTLIELLGVIIILGLIVLIAFPSIENNIKNSKQKLYNNQIRNIELGMKCWATDNLFYLPSEDGEMVTLTLNQLKQGGYVEKDVFNPLNDELFPNDMLVTITKKSNCFNYEVLVNTGTKTGTVVLNPDAPVLVINGSPIQRVEIYEIYTDPGVIALDSDGNLIDQSNVVTTISGSGSSVNTSVFGNYTVKYQVTDPDNGYKATVTRTVIVGDRTKPNLVVPSNTTISTTDVLTFNARTGATAIDNYDGDITSQIEITGNLSVLPGTYYLTYKVMDSNGNTTKSVIRSIKVIVTYNGPGYIASKSVNGPVLSSGMVPVKWNGSNWVETTTGDNDWYNYDTTDKKWANARTADGSMWVWIRRYIYRISSGWHFNLTGTIDVQFSKGIDDTRGGTVVLDTGTTANASNNKWTNHPAFTFGAINLTGIWVAKFEASGTTAAIDVKPNVTALLNAYVNDIFDATRSMETNSRYGWGTSGLGIDTHLMKNVEWGAVAYLSKSTYGKNTEVWINNSATYITGCAGNSVSAIGYIGCQNEYSTTNGQQASTTGNIYGIYDMSGGSGEYVAGYTNNSSASNYGLSLYNASNQYKDVYSIGFPDNAVSNYINAINVKGDAVYETSNSIGGLFSWFGDIANFPQTLTPFMAYPWFIRGGYSASTISGGIFNFDTASGMGHITRGFRPVLVINSGL